MKIRVNVWTVIMYVMVVVTSMCFTSCGDDDNNNGGKSNGLVGWYLRNNELLTKENWPKSASAYLDNNGVPQLMWSIDPCPPVIHIVDNSYLDIYVGAGLYYEGETGTEGKDMIYQIEEGKTAAYGTPKRLTYNLRTDGGIEFSLNYHQIILAKTETGFEVTSGYWGDRDNEKTFLKYDPNKAY